jgi:hypothetical protein
MFNIVHSFVGAANPTELLDGQRRIPQAELRKPPPRLRIFSPLSMHGALNVKAEAIGLGEWATRECPQKVTCLVQSDEVVKRGQSKMRLSRFSSNGIIRGTKIFLEELPFQ